MKTTQDVMKREIKRYIDHGFSVKGAAFQVRSLYLGRHDAVINQIEKELLA